MSILIVVVLPAPFGPRKAKISPAWTSSEMSSTAATVPYFLTRFLMRIMGPSFYGDVFVILKSPQMRPRAGVEMAVNRPTNPIGGNPGIGRLNETSGEIAGI